MTSLYWSNGVVQLHQADARCLPLPDASVHCVVTSPPYWGLRNYGLAGGIGLEPTLAEYVDNLVAVGRELWRVLRDDGTLWLNLGDAYAGSGKGMNADGTDGGSGAKQITNNGSIGVQRLSAALPAKNLLGLPWRVAFALQDDGWILRSAITWSKPNPMPESVRDRPTSASEMIFMFAKQGRYFYDADAIRRPYSPATIQRVSQPSFNDQTGGPKDYGGNRSARRGLENLKERVDKQRGHSRTHDGFNDRWDAMTRAEQQSNGANARNVWEIATQGRPDAHFATFPDELPRRCILAGTSEHGVCSECGAPWARIVDVHYENPSNSTTNGPRSVERRHETAGFEKRLVRKTTTTGWRPTCDHYDAPRVPATVLDPFIGSGTTAAVAQSLGRRAIGVDMNEDYLGIASRRVGAIIMPMALGMEWEL